MYATANLRQVDNSECVGLPSEPLRTQDSHRWGVILAGGDGKRLLPFTRRITGDDRPKQFCSLTGGETLLNQTLRRVGRLIVGQQTLLVMTRKHERHYAGPALPALQQACDLVRAHPNRTALMLAVEICSACYFVDDTIDTVIGNAICGDGAAAFLIGSKPGNPACRPAVVDSESHVASEHIDKVGFEHKDNKLRIILANEVRHLAGPLIERALDSLLERNRLSRADIRGYNGVGDRRQSIGGDFFESVPEGADTYILKNVLHDWSDDQAVRILKNCRRAMGSHAKMLAIEMVLPLSDDAVFGSLLDLNMLVMSGGRERTKDEYCGLLEKSGFRLTQVIPTLAPVSILEALAL